MVKDIVGIAGLLLTAVGLGMVYVPLALIATGAFLFWVSLRLEEGEVG